MKYMDARAKLVKSYGSGLFDVFAVPRISTGIFVMDYMTGGGVPKGRWTNFWGAKSTNKSSTLLRAINNYLLTHPNMRASLIDFEATYEEKWAKKILHPSVLKRFEPVTPDFGEQGIDIMVQIAMSEDIGFMGVDSVATMNPIGDASKSATDNSVGSLPRLMNKMYQKLSPIMGQSKRTGRFLSIVLVNQITSNVGGASFSPSMKKPGGHKQDLMASMDIRFFTKEYVKLGAKPADGATDNRVPIAVVHPFTVEKNKVGLPRRTGQFTMSLVDYKGRYATEILEEDQITSYAVRTGTISKVGKNWMYGKVVLGTVQKDLAAVLKKDKTLCHSIKRDTLKAIIADPMAGHKTAEEGEEVSEEKA